MATVDRNTGRADTAAAANNNYMQTQVTGPQQTNVTTQGVQATKGVQSTSGSSYVMNTTPTILSALENFITQMSDRPAISNEELNAQYPDAVAQFRPGNSGSMFAGGGIASSGGAYFVNPVTGTSMSAEEARRFNAEQAAKREKAKQQSGIIKGGTEQQRAISDARLQEIERNRQTQGKYTKEAAQADAQNLSGYFSRILSEQQMPGILRGAEGSGTSKGTTRALLTEQAIQRTAEVAAKTGLDASAQYGQINNQLASTLELLTRNDPNSTENQLLQALGIGKGIVQASSSSQSTATDQKTTTNQNQQQNQSQQVVQQLKQELPANNMGGTSPAQPRDTYTPSSMAGTMYVQADPYQEVSFGLNEDNGSAGSYSSGDDNYTF